MRTERCANKYFVASTDKILLSAMARKRLTNTGTLDANTTVPFFVYIILIF